MDADFFLVDAFNTLAFSSSIAMPSPHSVFNGELNQTIYDTECIMSNGGLKLGELVRSVPHDCCMWQRASTAMLGICVIAAFGAYVATGYLREHNPGSEWVRGSTSVCTSAMAAYADASSDVRSDHRSVDDLSPSSIALLRYSLTDADRIAAPDLELQPKGSSETAEHVSDSNRPSQLDERAQPDTAALGPADQPKIESRTHKAPPAAAAVVSSTPPILPRTEAAPTSRRPAKVVREERQQRRPVPLEAVGTGSIRPARSATATLQRSRTKGIIEPRNATQTAWRMPSEFAPSR